MKTNTEHTLILFQIPSCCAATRWLANRNHSKILKQLCGETGTEFKEVDPLATQDILIKMVQEQRPDVWEKVVEHGLPAIIESFPVVVMDGKIISMGEVNEKDIKEQILAIKG